MVQVGSTLMGCEALGSPTENEGGCCSNCNSKGEKVDDIYRELWQACAGPLVHVPHVGEDVFYFPQGHLEQVEAYTNRDGVADMPIYNIPAKLFCKVVNVHLKAEIYTDEVYAQVTLLPQEHDPKNLSVKDGESAPRTTRVSSFIKILTPSDTSTHGGFSVPKRQAEECLPPLDMSQQTPIQELVAKDLHGNEWRFRHIYRGQPKRHLLTSGWSSFVTSKKLVAGDACIFIREENGELRVGIRRATKLQNCSSTSIISGHSMQHGILASAYHAISMGTMFSVYYRPWTSPSKFIIPCGKYLKCTEPDYSVGTRFRMIFENEDCIDVQRYVGTVIGVEDFDHIRWPGSEWKCLKVQWDAKPDKLVRPEKVSPWNIEPIDNVSKDDGSIQPCLKRKHDPSTSGFSPMFMSGQGMRVTTPFGLGASGDRSMFRLVSPLNSKWSHMQMMTLESQLESPKRSSFYQHLKTAIPFADGNPHNVGIANSRMRTLINHGVSNVNGNGKNISIMDVGSKYQTWGASAAKGDMEAPPAQTQGSNKYKLFGVNIFSATELPSPQHETSDELHNASSIPLATPQSSISTSFQISEHLSDNPSPKRCKNCCCMTTRTCTKVLKYGTVLGRSVDLSRFDGYDELTSEIDEIFGFKGELINGSSGWHITYVDDEGDMMLIGSHPWKEFQSIVQRIFIYPKEENDKLIPTVPKVG